MGKIAKWKRISVGKFKEFVKSSLSYRELARKVGYAEDGGSGIAALKKAVKDLKIDDSHFKGQSWSRDLTDYSRFSENGNKKNGKTTLNALIRSRGRRCECCGRKTWNKQMIPLEVHHIDGNHQNNAIENLAMLCPNCHAQTKNYRGKNNQGVCIVSEDELVKALQENDTIANALISLHLSNGTGNYDRARKLIIKYNITKYINTTGG